MVGEGLKYRKNYQNMTQRHKVRKCYWKNGTNNLARCRVAINIQFVKSAISVKCSKAKCNKMRYACIIILKSYEVHKWKLSREWWRSDLETFPDKNLP